MTTGVDVRYLDRTTPPHLSTLILLSALSALGMNIFLPSLPAMSAHFDTEYKVMQLSVALYLGVNAILQVVIGPLSDYFGRRPMILGSIVLFNLATLGCLFAPNATVFLIFRMAQAVIVAGMVLSRAIVRDIVSPAKAGSMIGYVTMGMAVAPMIAPALGGLMEGLVGWQGSFWLLFVSGVIMFWVCWRDIGETSVRHSPSLAAQVRQYPELLMSRRFWGYALTAAFSSGAFFAYLGGAPFVGSEVFGMAPAVLGIYFGAPALGYMAGNGVSGRYSAQVGLNPMIFTGTLLAAAGTALPVLLFLGGGGGPVAFFGFMTLVGLGNGLVLPNATAGMLSVRPRLSGSASGLGGAIMIGGGAALSSLAGALLTEGSGAMPLLWIMFVTSVASIVAIVYVIWRERRLAA